MSYFNKKSSSHIKDGHSKKNNRTDFYTPKQVSKDYGPAPFLVDIEKVTKSNNTFRTTLWTGEYLQVTLMSIPPGEELGAEIHNNLDQFIRIEQGRGVITMGDSKDTPSLKQLVFDDYVIIIPAGKWHNLVNIGSTPLKLYSIYTPPEHPHGTIHQTKAIAQEADKHH